MTRAPGEIGGGLDALVAVEFTGTHGAGFAASMLADSGANVVVCEDREGSALRRVGGGALDAPRWRIMARNKRSIAADWRDPSTGDILVRLFRRADLLITDSAPPDRPGAAWFAAFSDIPEPERPLLVEIFPTGADRPDLWRWGVRPEFAAAAGGMMALTGYEGGKPTQPEAPVADYLAGALGSARALMALRRAHLSRGPKGEIGVPLDAALHRMIEWQCPVATAFGRAEIRMGNNFPMNAGIANMHKTAEGKYIAVSAVTQPTALRLMTMVGGPALCADPRFATPEARGAGLDAFYAIVDRWMEARGVADILAEAASHDVVLGPIYDTEDVLADPHLAARGNILTVTTDGETVIMPAPAPRPDGEAREMSPGPAIGAHSTEILQWLGLPAEEIERLGAAGTVIQS